MRWEREYMEVFKKVSILVAIFALVACDNSPAPTDNQFVKSNDPICDGQRVEGEYLVHWKSGKITVEKSMTEDSFVKNFLVAHTDEILKAEPHYRIQIEQNNVKKVGKYGGFLNWGQEYIKVDDVWDNNFSREEVIVAVIDSGMDVEHPELVDALAINDKEIPGNGIDDDNNGYVDDVNGYDFVADSGRVIDYTGHGTHVAGVIAAQHDRGQVLGVAPSAKLLPLAFISATGGGLVSGAVGAIRYAASQGAKVINASWGGRSCSNLLREEIAAVAKNNVLFVAAAGNSGNDLSITPEYPAAFQISNSMTVGAGTPSNNMAEFSNFGLLVDIVAPGVDVFSTYPPEFDNDGTRDGVVILEGTSMATPYVAGAAALLWSIYPEAQYSDIKAALLQGVTPGPLHVKTRGYLDIPRALDALN